MHLKRLRLQRGLSQAALAKKAGLSMVWIIQIEKHRVDPSLSTLRKLAKALKVTVGELVE